MANHSRVKSVKSLLVRRYLYAMNAIAGFIASSLSPPSFMIFVPIMRHKIQIYGLDFKSLIQPILQIELKIEKMAHT